jgi:hypothetical protein
MEDYKLLGQVLGCQIRDLWGEGLTSSSEECSGALKHWKSLNIHPPHREIPPL